MGQTFFVNCEQLLFVDDNPLFAWRIENGIVLISSIFLDANGQRLLEVKDNEVIGNTTSLWDFEFKYNRLKVKNGPKNLLFDLDLRKEPALARGECYCGTKKIKFDTNPSHLRIAIGKTASLRTTQISLRCDYARAIIAEIKELGYRLVPDNLSP